MYLKPIFSVYSDELSCHSLLVQVFVANPRKPDAINSILFKNKDKLVAYLRNFHNDRDDYQFAEEKALVIDTLVGLAKPETQYSCLH